MATRGETGGVPTATVRDATFGDVADTVSADLAPALSACDFPLLVWLSPVATITMANRAATELLGVELESLIGSSAIDLLLSRSAAERAVAGITTDDVENIRRKVVLTLADGTLLPAWTWTRAIQVNGQRGGVTLITRSSDIGKLGRDIVAPWRDLVPVAVGTIDAAWRVETVSVDIREVTGGTPGELTGRVLLDLLLPEDRQRVEEGLAASPSMAMSWCRLRMRARGTWVEACLLVSAPGQSRLRLFALIGPPQTAEPPANERVAELELRLRHIAAEVRAAGVLEGLGDMPSASDVPELQHLTSRQWEILSRLVQGQRVSAIAAALFISPSTVRNHLTTIFRRFNVHSQAELLERLRTSGSR